VAESPRRVLLDLYVAYQLCGGLIELELEDTGITAEEYALYSVLSHHGELTPTQVAKELGLPLSSAIFRAGRLIQRGHAQRLPNPRDRRSSLVALTPEGLELLEVARPAFDRVLDRLAAHLERPADVQDVLIALAEAAGSALAEVRDEQLLRERAAS
jgi:DNA-binding MarR family transcriptional regulator